MKRVKVTSEILIEIQDDRTNVDETILAIETALNAFYYYVLEQDSSWPDGLLSPDKIGLRFHFWDANFQDINVDQKGLGERYIEELEESTANLKREIEQLQQKINVDQKGLKDCSIEELEEALEKKRDEQKEFEKPKQLGIVNTAELRSRLDTYVNSWVKSGHCNDKDLVLLKVVIDTFYKKDVWDRLSKASYYGIVDPTYPSEIIPGRRDESKKLQDTEVELELSEELLLACLLCAHEEDITFNEWINKIIREEINKNG